MPPPLRKYLGDFFSEKGELGNKKENKKTKRGGKKNKKGDVARIFCFKRILKPCVRFILQNHGFVSIGRVSVLYSLKMRFVKICLNVLHLSGL